MIGCRRFLDAGNREPGIGNRESGLGKEHPLHVVILKERQRPKDPAVILRSVATKDPYAPRRTRRALRVSKGSFAPLRYAQDDKRSASTGGQGRTRTARARTRGRGRGS